MKYTTPKPNRYNDSGYGNKIAVFANIYPAVFSLPISTGSIGTFTDSYSSLDFIAKDQKEGGVHKKTNNPIRKPRISIDPVVVAHPAIDAALPANPPTTIFETFERLSHNVYTNT